MSDRTDWTVTCAGGCGRTQVPNMVTDVFAARYCPECQRRLHVDVRGNKR